MELRKKEPARETQWPVRRDKEEALRMTLKELRNGQAINRAEPRNRQNMRRLDVSARRLNQIRTQENVAQQNRVYQARENQKINNIKRNLTGPKSSNSTTNINLDERSLEFANFIATQESLEGLTLEQAVERRLENLEQEKARANAPDPSVEFSKIPFANELRMAQYLDILAVNPSLIFASYEFKEVLAQQGQNSLEWVVALWREINKKRKKFKYFSEDDLMEVLVIQFYPILLSAITKVLSRGVTEDVISSEMPSYNGELVQLMRQAAAEDHPAHAILEQVKEYTQFSGDVAWDDSDLI
ncbi:MAG: hypothetical protein NZT61_00915 [Deltaproteobacteria bacterium]|nr:hypothetical protein [Deltaproteobacteria bacterium]MCX7952107.1 hypothetical protein [Deltaproteobacteria bacterium]